MLCTFSSLVSEMTSSSQTDSYKSTWNLLLKHLSRRPPEETFKGNCVKTLQLIFLAGTVSRVMQLGNEIYALITCTDTS